MASIRDRLNRNLNLRASRGFTLIELLTAVTVVAILTAIGIPSYRLVTTSNRIASEVNGLLGDLQFARVEAIKEGQTVTVCSSTDGATCAGSTSWTVGWIVFDDINGNQTVDANEPVFKVQTRFTGTDTFLADNNVSAVSFNREGFASNLTLLVNPITLTLHEVAGSTTRGRCLHITLVGMLSTESVGSSANCT